MKNDTLSTDIKGWLWSMKAFRYRARVKEMKMEM